MKKIYIVLFGVIIIFLPWIILISFDSIHQWGNNILSSGDIYSILFIAMMMFLVTIGGGLVFYGSNLNN